MAGREKIFELPPNAHALSATELNAIPRPRGSAASTASGAAREPAPTFPPGDDGIEEIQVAIQSLLTDEERDNGNILLAELVEDQAVHITWQGDDIGGINHDELTVDVIDAPPGERCYINTAEYHGHRRFAPRIARNRATTRNQGRAGRQHCRRRPRDAKPRSIAARSRSSAPIGSNIEPMSHPRQNSRIFAQRKPTPESNFSEELGGRLR